MNYVVNTLNPFMRKARDCFHASSYDLACMQCQTYGQANSPEHADCFEPKIMQWTHNWTRFEDVQKMLSIH